MRSFAFERQVRLALEISRDGISPFLDSYYIRIVVIRSIVKSGRLPRFVGSDCFEEHAPRNGVFAPMTASPIDTMISGPHTTTSMANARSSAVLSGRAQWTGRSRVSSETNTVLAQISTSGFHRTRVSALRNAAGDAAWNTMLPCITPQRTYTRRPDWELFLR